ncbi:glycosyltransferase [Salininema proteolyticum]|uniref:Glycosyltransferase n=1 Tax=Salininema proteolyticum TaxID=1607685 RepID=A0ABV8U352_9ACTN
MKITFAIRHAYGLGGTVKCTIDSANALAERGHDVTLLSLVRQRTEPRFPIHRKVSVRALWDRRRRSDGGETLSAKDKDLSQTPSATLVDGVNALKMPTASALYDVRLAKFLRRHRADVVIGTHVGINLLLARAENRRAAHLGQEHLYYSQYHRPVKAAIKEHYTGLDGVVTLTELDADDYRRALPELSGKLWTIPNSVPRNDLPRGETEAPFVMAAGRLAPGKRFNVLIRAFAALRQSHPEWRLRLYGDGPERRALEKTAADEGVLDRVDFMGTVAPLEAEWVKATVAVSASRMESFGLTLVEAMAAGTPLVSSNVEYGPMEFIEDGRNGILVEPDDPSALARALARTMDDPALRARLAAGGRETAARFEPAAVVDKLERLLEDLAGRARNTGILRPRGRFSRLFRPGAARDPLMP